MADSNGRVVSAALMILLTSSGSAPVYTQDEEYDDSWGGGDWVDYKVDDNWDSGVAEELRASPVEALLNDMQAAYYFYYDFNPYGEWLWVPVFGYIWHPVGVWIG